NERIISSNNAQTDPRTSEFSESYLKPLGITSLMDTSFLVSGKLLGVVSVEHIGKPREWKNDEIAFIDEISSQLSQVYSNSERKRSEKVQSALFKISEASNTSKSIEELLKIIHTTLETFIDVPNFFVALYNQETGLYAFPYSVDECDDIYFSPSELRNSLTDYVRKTGESILIDAKCYAELSENHKVCVVGTLPPIWLGVPLKTAQGIIGVAVVQDYHNADAYTMDDLELLSSISNYLAMAIERKQMINQKISLQEELERAQRMESLGILAGGVAHDLNNMLGPLVGYPELILMKLPEDSPIRKQVKRIGRSAKDAADVIQDLLTLARRGRYEMEPTNLVEVVEFYLDSPSHQKLAEERPEITINCDFQDKQLFINGSSPHLSKVVMNLIVNASDAMATSGDLSISVTQESLDKLYGGFNKIEPGNYTILKVRDTGMGIEGEDLDKIFEPYYSKKKMGSSGSGLGLSVVYGIVKDHHGYYDIFSSKGKGTEFILYFPAIEKPANSIIDPKDEIGGQETILIIDDAPEQRDIATEFLSSLGYNAVTAENGHKAIDYLSHNQVDLIMIDMIMEKDFDGLDTYRQIVKMHPGQKAIVVSGFSATERVDEMLALGAGAYVKKPFTFGALSKAIRDELDRPEDSKVPVI
ncbi:MAG: response regulator, partial [candidate division Zixibacteria bacterium]|nr:response regulator [candidate division Zixibacteria bacterium]